MSLGFEEPADNSSRDDEYANVEPVAEDAAVPGKELPFPVLEERWLSYAPGKFLRGARRDPSVLPKARPGTVLVFRAGSRYVAFDSHKHLTGKEEYVVDATAVCLVDMRTRIYMVLIPIPSASPADDFTIRATFRARVSSPERAAKEGAIDVTRFLEGYLAKDPKLFKLGSSFRVESIEEVRDQVTSRIEAYCELHPIDLPGLSIALDSSSVLTPSELREHERLMRDERRRQEFDRLRAAGEDADIRRHAGYVDEGSSSLTAVGLSRGETSVNDAINNAREDERRQQERIAEAFRILQQNGALDYVDIDPTEMANAYLESLTGQPVPRAKSRQIREPDTRGALSSGLDSDLDDDDDDEIDDVAGK
jgi:hypothetical protein